MGIIVDLLSKVQLSGNVFIHSNFSGQWGARCDQISDPVFHAVLHGSCWFGIQQDDSTYRHILLKEGDVAFLPRGKAHFVANSSSTVCKEIAIRPGLRCLITDIPDEDAEVRLLCGVFNFTEGLHHPLLMMLPEFIHARFSSDVGRYAMGGHAAYSIANVLESDLPVNSALIDRLHEVLFIQLLQKYASSNEFAHSFASGRNASRIYRVLEAIYKDPGHEWNLNKMADLACLSRSAFTSCFRQVVGVSAVSYLTCYRMYSARLLIQKTGVSLKTISRQLGFSTASGFNKAFKRYFGTSPTELRDSLY